MAFWSLYKWFAPWSKRGYPDMIYYFSEYVVKTPEQREKESIIREKRAEAAIKNLSAMYNIFNKNGEIDRIRKIYNI